MKLPFPFFHNNKEAESEYYLALLLTDEKAAAVILHESAGKLKLLSKHEEFFSSSLEAVEHEELIRLVDKTISRAEEILPPNIETHKTVFGVKDSWVEKDTKKIKKDYLSKLKKVCDSLDLSPIGFMVITEAISHLVQEEEGAPLSAILGEIGNKTVTLSLLRGGKIVEQIDGPLVDSAPATVDTLLKHFTTAVLPARLILYDAKEAEKLSQQFIGHQWSKSLPFLHVPQVMALPSGFDAKAVTFGAASQMGFEVLGLDSLPKASSHPIASDEPPSEEKEAKEAEEEKKESDEEESAKENDEKESQEETETPSIIAGDNFGFVTDQDITEAGPPPKRHHGPHLVEQEKTADIETPLTERESLRVNLNQEEKEATDDERPTKASMPNLFGFLAGLRLPRLPFMTGASGKKKLLIPLGIVIGIIIVLSILTSYYFNSVNAKIVLSVTPKMVDQEANVTFSAATENDFSKNVIAAKSIETTVDGSLAIDTTGKKDVGNKAKGTVTLYNNDSKSVKLDNGAQIKASNGVIFLLDKDVTIASASGDIFSGTKPGTADVAVTAKDIGTEGNLPSGTKFTIGNNSSLAAKNDSAFSGGSKKQVQVVSKNDVAKLRAELPKNLEARAKDAIAQKLSSDETLLPFMGVKGLSREKFDNDVDKEAKQVKLTATVTFQSLAYNNEDVNNYAKFLLKDKYSQDISEKSIKNTVADPEENKDGQVDADLILEAGLLPDIDTGDVVNRVENMSLKEALAFLSDLPQIAEAKVNFEPAIPLLPNFMPRLPNQVSVEVKTE
jgi:hypothetical protein